MEIAFSGHREVISLDEADQAETGKRQLPANRPKKWGYLALMPKAGPLPM
jgi:hypothetical protein